MRILFCTNSLWAYGGIERVTIVKANAFAEVEGCEVAVCYTDRGMYSRDPIHPISSKVCLIDLGVTFWDLFPLSFKNLTVVAARKFWALRKQLQRTIAEFSPDVVITTGSYEKFAVASINPTKITGHPSVKVREYHFNSNYRRYESSSLLSGFFEWFEYNVLGSRFDMNYLLTKENLDTDFRGRRKFDYQYNPYPFDASCPLPPFESRTDTVIAVNRLVGLKNTDGLLRAWARIADRVGSWRLMIVGEGDQRHALERLAHDLHVADSVVFLGFRHDVRQLLLSSKLLAVTSKYEGFGMSIIEACGCGVVPVSYRTPYGPADIITDGVDGVLVDYMDEAQFAACLISLMNDQSSIERMSRAAAERARRFSIPVIVDEWMQKYTALLDAKKSASAK